MSTTKLTMAILATCGLLSFTSACAAVEGRETAGNYVDDATITTKVKADLVKDQALKGFDIHVETMNDIVQLSGFVDNPVQKSNAERIATNIEGVRGVHNNIIIRPAGSAS